MCLKRLVDEFTLIENRLFVEDKTWWTTCHLIRLWWRWAWWIRCSTSSACNKWWWCSNSKDNRHNDTWALLLPWLLAPTTTAMHPTSHPRRKSHPLAMSASSARSQAIGSTTVPMCLKGNLCKGQAAQGSVHDNEVYRVSPIDSLFAIIEIPAQAANSRTKMATIRSLKSWLAWFAIN